MLVLRQKVPVLTVALGMRIQVSVLTYAHIMKLLILAMIPLTVISLVLVVSVPKLLQLLVQLLTKTTKLVLQIVFVNLPPQVLALFPIQSAKLMLVMKLYAQKKQLPPNLALTTPVLALM